MSEREEMEMTDEYEIKQLKKKLEIAKYALMFYSTEDNWLGVNDDRENYLSKTKWLRIIEDDMDSEYLGGKTARQALAAINGEGV